jgi:acyl carrier protein
MGLDTVEIILRTEEVFAIDLPDEECGQVVTVGDLFRLVLNKLNLPYTSVDAMHSGDPHGRSRANDTYPSLIPWTASDVWPTIQAIIEDQLQVDREEITESATFIDDLHCD